MDNCYQPNVCNCVRDCSCDDGYECCSEKTKNKPRYGLCVKKGTCDKERGICRTKGTASFSTSESYNVKSKEGYNDKDNCKKWKISFWILSAILLISLLFTVKCYNKRN